MSSYRGSFTHRHYHVGDCVADFIREVYKDIPESEQEAVWTAVGIIVDVAIRRPLQVVPEPRGADEPSAADPDPDTSRKLPANGSEPDWADEVTVERDPANPVPLIAMDGRRDCWICGKIFARHRGLSVHLGKVHPHAVGVEPTEPDIEEDGVSEAEKRWRESHGPNVPYQPRAWKQEGASA